jgi:hypothetical protein
MQSEDKLCELSVVPSYHIIYGPEHPLAKSEQAHNAQQERCSEAGFSCVLRRYGLACRRSWSFVDAGGDHMKLDFFSGSDGLSPSFDRNAENIQEVKRRFPSAWQLAGEALAMAELLISFAETNTGPSTRSDYRKNLLAVWNRIRLYQINSILEIFAGNLDEGLAILRMAAELGFVFKALDSDERNLQLWVQGSQSQSFKKAGRMDFGNRTEKRIYDLYKFCCRFGTHGHITNFAFQEFAIESSQANVYAASKIAKYWFASFMPLHTFAFEALLRGNTWEGIDEWRLVMINMEIRLVDATRTDPFFRIESSKRKIA